MLPELSEECARLKIYLERVSMSLKTRPCSSRTSSSMLLSRETVTSRSSELRTYPSWLRSRTPSVTEAALITITIVVEAVAMEVAADTVVVAAAMAPNVEDTVAKKEEATVVAAVATSAEDTEEETEVATVANNAEATMEVVAAAVVPVAKAVPAIARTLASLVTSALTPTNAKLR